MKKILYLTFYFEPDLCAGSFRNSPLVKELAKQVEGKASIDVITTLPNRYNSFNAEAVEFEQRNNYTVRRIAIPKHQSGMKDQILSFKTYYSKVKRLVKGKKYDLVVASSSRLFTAYLGYTIAKKMEVPLYLDIRDIFYDTLEDVLKDGIIKRATLPIIKYIEKRTFSSARHINLISEGFRPYFSSYKQAEFSFFPNGIDDIFLEANEEAINNKIPIHENPGRIKTIVYAGNIGEGQGLHKIVPSAAKALQGKIKFIIIGDGGAKEKLESEIKQLNIDNVEFHPPIKRNELIEVYKNADFLFAHLNDFSAFEKVLPSKLFELATFPKPLIAGLSGFAGQFVKDNIDNSILFDPCNVESLVKQLENYNYKQVKRTAFMQNFRREAVNRKMVESILKYI